MTVTLTNPDPTDPLSTPSHASLHVSTNNAISSLTSRVGFIESSRAGVAEDIEQARRVSNTWVVHDELTVSDRPVMPLLWNLTTRSVEYESARLSVLIPPAGGDIVVEIQDGGDETSDPTSISAGAIATLTIPDGEYFSAPFTSGFVSAMQEPNHYLQVVVTAVGATFAGSDLTVQLNRLL